MSFPYEVINPKMNEKQFKKEELDSLFSETGREVISSIFELFIG